MIFKPITAESCIYTPIGICDEYTLLKVEQKANFIYEGTDNFAVTLEDLIYDNYITSSYTDDEIEPVDNTIMDECLEVLDIYSETFAFEGEKWERFKNTVKGIFLKIISVIKKVIRFVIKIITWPFRMIYRLLFRKKNKDIERAIAFRHKDLTIETSISSYIRSISEIQKEKEEFTKSAIIDLKEIGNYVKECENIADECIRQKYYISIDDISRAVEGNLKSREKDIKERRTVIHEELTNIDSERVKYTRLKGTEIYSALSEISTILEKNVDTSTKGIDKLLTGVLNEITKLETKITNAKNEYINDMDRGGRDVIHEMLSLIRAYVTDLASINIDITKYFSTIDKEIHEIDKIVGYVIDGYTRDQVIDTIGGVDVVVDDLFFAHIKISDWEMFKAGGAMCMKTHRHNVSKLHFGTNNKSVTIRDDRSDKTTITISKGIAALKNNSDPKKVKWYYSIIGHEYGHHYSKKYLEDFGKDKAVDPRHWDSVTDEVISDRIGNKISGLTKEEYVERDIWLDNEYIRLCQVYEEYLAIPGANMKPTDKQLKYARFNLGARYRHL